MPSQGRCRSVRLSLAARRVYKPSKPPSLLPHQYLPSLNFQNPCHKTPMSSLVELQNQTNKRYVCRRFLSKVQCSEWRMPLWMSCCFCPWAVQNTNRCEDISVASPACMPEEHPKAWHWQAMCIPTARRKIQVCNVTSTLFSPSNSIKSSAKVEIAHVQADRSVCQMQRSSNAMLDVSPASEKSPMLKPNRVLQISHSVFYNLAVRSSKVDLQKVSSSGIDVRIMLNFSTEFMFI